AISATPTRNRDRHSRMLLDPFTRRPVHTGRTSTRRQTMRRFVGMFVVGVVAVAGAQSGTMHAQGNAALEKNKVLAQRFHLDMIQNRNLDIADQIIAPDCAIHLPNGTAEARGPERAKRVAGGDHRAYPKGISFTHDIVMAEGDYVTFHWTLVG